MASESDFLKHIGFGWQGPVQEEAEGESRHGVEMGSGGWLCGEPSGRTPTGPAPSRWLLSTWAPLLQAFPTLAALCPGPSGGSDWGRLQEERAAIT